jgi:hypothetical protein
MLILDILTIFCQSLNLSAYYTALSSNFDAGPKLSPLMRGGRGRPSTKLSWAVGLVNGVTAVQHRRDDRQDLAHLSPPARSDYIRYACARQHAWTFFKAGLSIRSACVRKHSPIFAARDAVSAAEAT